MDHFSTPEVRSAIADRLISRRELVGITGQGRTSSYNLQDPSHPAYDPEYPGVLHVGKRAVRFSEKAAFQWVQRKVEAGAQQLSYGIPQVARGNNGKKVKP